jgi:hypothetical protein
MIPRLLLLGTCALAAVACADRTTPAALVGPIATSGAMNVQLHQVAGSGHVQQPAGMREFTFHALEQPDGSVTGSFKVVLASGLFFEADVTCLAVGGNTGWVAGTIRATNAAPVVIGSVSTFYAIDNGEGDQAGDIVSLATFNGAAGADAAFCANRPLVLPQLAVTDGNVQVR